MIEALALLSIGQAREVEQDHEGATLAPKIDRTTARIAWSSGSIEIAQLMRGMDSVPGAWTTLEGADLKLFAPTPTSEADRAEPGTVVTADGRQGLRVSTGDGALVVGEVQPPGKRRMRAADWISGRGVSAGQRFE